MIGLPELWDQLELRGNRSLYSRLSTRLHITPSESDETCEYIAYRLSTAGCASPNICRACPLMAIGFAEPFIEAAAAHRRWASAARI